MGLFTRKPDLPAPPAANQAPPLDLASALEIVLCRSVEAQATMASKIGELITSQMETMAATFQAKFSRKGGKARAAKAAREKNGTFKRGIKCRLCDNPSISNPTSEEIRAHINHENPAMNYRIVDGAVHVDADVSEIQIDPQGNQVVECAECAQGIQHSHGRN